MSGEDLKGSAWDRIMADPELKRARQKLSMHEIMTMIRHVWAAEEVTGETVKIYINGERFNWGSPVITHEEVCDLVGQPSHASVTYSYKVREGKLSGLTFSGKSVSVYPRMEFDCVVTGDA